MFSKEHIRLFCIKSNKKIRDFLFSKKNREFLIFLFFLVVASVFWLIQTLNDSYNSELNIPFRLKNVPQNVVLTLEPPEHLQVSLQDKGTVLLNYQYGQTFYPITADFKELTASGDQRIRIPSSRLQKLIASQLSSSTRIVSIHPDTLDIIYTRGQSKRVPVKLTGSYTAAKQHYIAKIKLSPDTVTVYAPRQILDTLRTAYTAPIELTNLSDTLTRKIALQDVRGAKFVPGSVQAKFITDLYTEKTVEVDIVGTDFPANKRLKTFPSKAKVTFQVGLSRFKKITSKQFRIEIPYNELKKCTTDKFPLSIATMPAEIYNVRIQPSYIDYLIEETNAYEH